MAISGQTIIVGTSRESNNTGAAYIFTVSPATTTSVPAELVGPAPGTVLTSATSTFSWDLGNDVTQCTLLIGTTGVGSSNVATVNPTFNRSATVSGLPTLGERLYVRLASLTSAGWQSRDYIYTAAYFAKAFIQSPLPGSVLTGTSVTFTWSRGSGASQYHIYVGSTGAGSNNVFSLNTGSANSQTASGLPTNGSTLYVRIWTLIDGSWLFSDYTYSAISSGSKAIMLSPVPGIPLLSSPQTFTWTAVPGATQYHLYVGGTGVGSDNLFSKNTGSVTSQVVGVLTHASVYVRLWTLFGGVWQFNDYVYSPGNSPTAVMLRPSPPSFASEEVFSWSQGIGVSQYHLYIGTTGPGSRDFFTLNTGTATQVLVTGMRGIPFLFVRLWSLVEGVWLFNDYTYGYPRSVLQMPSTLSGSTVTFKWNNVRATQHHLYVGTTGAGSSNLFSLNTGSAISQVVAGLPANGSTIFARLWTLVAGVWEFNDYTYVSGP